MTNYATDNFAHIIGVRRREAERVAEWERWFYEWDRIRRRDDKITGWFFAAIFVGGIAWITIRLVIA